MISRRVLLCIGCDQYDYLDGLNGAEIDARNIFDTLRNPGYGNYSTENSALLLSPTSHEIDIALTSLLAHSDAIDTLTIFFAGHGVVAKGSYYLCTRDTAVNRFSTTSYSLNRLFEVINENQPAQCNIIIDACESGGLVANLGALLKPELLGTANTSGISIFASSAAKQYSADTSSGGLGTNQILKVLRGEIIVQTDRPFLDLVEVGRISAGLIEAEASTLSYSDGNPIEQTPVVWGLNLFGQSRFTLNPAYDVNRPVSIHSLVSIDSNSKAGLTISASSDDIWRLFYEPIEKITPEKIFNTIRPINLKIGNEDTISRFMSGVAVSLLEKTQHSGNSFARAEVLGTLIALLLEWTGKNGSAELQIREFTLHLQHILKSCLIDLLDKLENHTNFLVVDGLADFYYLPIRISKIFGWIGAYLHFSRLLSDEDVNDAILAENLISKLVEEYSACCFFINDCQSPFVLTALSATKDFNLIDSGLNLFGLYSSQIFKDAGKIAHSRLERERVYDFLKNRSLSPESLITCFANPSEAISVILKMANEFDLADTIDPYMAAIDHVSHFVFIPDSYRDFSRQTIESGRNHGFQVGHGIWTTADFEERWRAGCMHQMSSDASLSSTSVRLASLCAALIFPDRTPWFLLDGRTDFT